MGKIIKKRIEYGGSSNSAENIKYDDTKNVKQAIDGVKSDIAGVKSDIADVNSNLIGFPDYANGVIVMDNVDSGSWTADENCMVIADNIGGSGYIIIIYNGTLSLAAANIPFFIKKGDVISIGYAYDGAKAKVTKYPLR